MRTRLVAVMLGPLIVVLLVLGGAFATAATHNVQQHFYAERLDDLNYFVARARQALLSGNSSIIDAEAARFAEVYRTRIVLLDRTGSPWSSGARRAEPIGETTAARVPLVLSGQRSDLAQTVLPWTTDDAVLVEPVLDDRDVIGAVVLSASTAAPRAEILRQWAVLLIAALLATSAAALVVFRLANWVLAPIKRADVAMAAIEQGDMEARIADDTGPPELRRMILLFNRMAGEIERVVSRQQEFALNASHELRNPLNALLLRVEYLATGLGEHWSADVEETREEGRRITRILDTLLSLARTGHGDAVLTSVDLRELAANRVEAWRGVAAHKRVALDTSRLDQAFSLTDSTIVESALDAVIDNAVKFSPPGASVEVSTVRDHQQCRVVVRDHGPGLPAADVDRVTERFWRSPGHQNVAGSGLGLAIASDLLVSVNGRLSVTAPDCGGLEVSLQLFDGTLR